MAHDDTYAWLDPDLAVLQCGLDLAEDDPREALFENVRMAAAETIESKRADLVSAAEDHEGEFVATPRIIQAGLLVVARLWARKDSPFGFVAFPGLESAERIVATDADVRELIGRNRKAAFG